MKLATVRRDGREIRGRVDGDTVVDMQAADGMVLLRTGIADEAA